MKQGFYANYKAKTISEIYMEFSITAPVTSQDGVDSDLAIYSLRSIPRKIETNVAQFVFFLPKIY